MFFQSLRYYQFWKKRTYVTYETSQKLFLQNKNRIRNNEKKYVVLEEWNEKIQMMLESLQMC